MEDEELNPPEIPPADARETMSAMSAMEKEAFADALRDVWDQVYDA